MKTFLIFCVLVMISAGIVGLTFMVLTSPRAPESDIRCDIDGVELHSNDICEVVGGFDDGQRCQVYEVQSKGRVGMFMFNQYYYHGGKEYCLKKSFEQKQLRLVRGHGRGNLAIIHKGNQ